MTYIKQAFARATPRKIRVLCSALNKPMPKYRPGTREVTVQYFEHDQITQEQWDNAVAAMMDTQVKQ